MRLSRTTPNEPKEGKLICLQIGNDGPIIDNLYQCENAFGVEYTKDRTGNTTLIHLNDGYDRVYGTLKKTGTLYYKLDLDDQLALSKRIAILKLERKFKREDTYTLDSQSTIDFEEKILELFEETECEEDQARMVLEGSAYYDVETIDGNGWIRILCEYGDLIIIPAHRAHRLTPTNKNFVKIRRFFKDSAES